MLKQIQSKKKKALKYSLFYRPASQMASTFRLQQLFWMMEQVDLRRASKGQQGDGR